jgi:NhaP-type Na+/H+ or K+/H+ antiporter
LSVIFFADVTGIISLIKKSQLTINDWKLLLTGLLIIFGVPIVTIKMDLQTIALIILFIQVVLFLLIIWNSINSGIDDDKELKSGKHPKKSIPVN